MYHAFPTAKILRVDLNTLSIKTQDLPSEVYRKYPGGSALGVYLVTREMDPSIDPLSPENVLVFSVSALTGLPISGISRMNVAAKSPLTGGMGDSQAGGFFPVHLKANGYDAVVFTGKAQKPVYLFIEDDHVELKPADFIWGDVTGVAEEKIRQSLGREDLEIAQIGPAGENMVKYACIINMCNRANGRNGMGAVMGSKNVKAVVVARGKAKAAVDAEGFQKLSKSVTKRLDENKSIAGLGKYGTSRGLENFSDTGFLPTKNWSTGYFPEGAKKITGRTMYDTVLKSRDTCFSCAVRCKRVVEIPGLVDPLYGGPEYETAASFGSYCGIDDLAEICLANQLCNMYGIDTISCGATIAFAMECFENNFLSTEETDGLKLTFGNSHVLKPLIEKIARREGIGNELAEGSEAFAATLDEGAKEFLSTVKKQEMPAHMPQHKPSVGLIYAVNSFGADHQSSVHDPILVLPDDSREKIRLAKLGITKGYPDSFGLDFEKVRFAYETQKYYSVLDTLCLCQFVWGPAWQLYGPDSLLELCKTGIGWDTSLYELMQVGERRINMMRAFNISAGLLSKDDALPKKVFKPLRDGPTDGTALDPEEVKSAITMYYQLAGWDEQGIPTDMTLKKLSLDWMRE